MKNNAMNMGIDKGKVIGNAWYLKKTVMPAAGFGACLRRAWRAEKMRRAQRLAAGMPANEPGPAGCRTDHHPEFVAGCIAYYAEARPGCYFGD